MEEKIQQVVSVFEKGAVLDKKGVVIDHDFVVKGTICTKITCSSKIEVEAGAKVVGEIIAGEMVINGTVEGTVFVKGTVRLCPNSRVKGQIYYGDIIIEKGALLRGESEKLTPAQASKYFKNLKPAQRIAAPAPAPAPAPASAPAPAAPAAK